MARFVTKQCTLIYLLIHSFINLLFDSLNIYWEANIYQILAIAGDYISEKAKDLFS